MSDDYSPKLRLMMGGDLTPEQGQEGLIGEAKVVPQLGHYLRRLDDLPLLSG